MRLENKVAIVIGAGQSPGEAIGNGRATALRFLGEGARVLAVDRDKASAEATLEMAGDRAAHGVAFEADVTREASIKAAIDAGLSTWGRIDILHYNVGVSLSAGDQILDNLTEEAFDRVNAINLRGAIMAAKHVIPVMRKQMSGVLLNIGSISAIETTYQLVAYKTSKMGMIALTQQLAVQNAAYGVRVNCILPGLMDTSMGVDTRVRTTGRSRAEIVAERDAKVPLRGKMGTGWDVANAAVFLASDEASFITGVSLPVDGGALARIGF
jgi:NAD(P)-dependent dehydrogenase (short-subunit alcohol dehydrogenase family)